jgi:hypothetical protein
MVSMPDLATPMATDPSDLLPLSPFNSLRYHFGMLLGVDDFETEQAYHRAKMRLHNSWLHREGVVWGFGVTVDAARGEILVRPGLALDAVGHELHLDGDHCINVGEWFSKHEKDPGFDIRREGFEAHVVICFKACLNRQVPALMEPCGNGGSSTEYSRVSETLEIRLLPGRAPERVYPYHRLRLMFGLVEAATSSPAKVNDIETNEIEIEEFTQLGEASFREIPLDPIEISSVDTPKDQALLDAAKRDQAVLDRMKEIEALPPEKQPAARMQAFHEFAALDEIDLQPATSEDGARTLLFPGREDDCVVLADIAGLTLTTSDNRSVLSGGTVDTSVRPSHIATTTIQDLLCGTRLGATQSQPEDSGPRVDPTSVNLTVPNVVMFSVTKEILDASVKPDAFSVTSFDAAEGWRRLNIVTAEYGGGETKTIKLELDRNMSGRVRLIVFGTGPTPLMGADKVPLAGAVGGPAGTLHDGHDFVFMRDYVRGKTGSGDVIELGEASQAAKIATAAAATDAEIRGSSSRARTRRSKLAK